MIKRLGRQRESKRKRKRKEKKEKMLLLFVTVYRPDRNTSFMVELIKQYLGDRKMVIDISKICSTVEYSIEGVASPVP